MKTCKRCNQKKDVYEFNRDRQNLDGRCSWCKECHLEYKRERAKSFPVDTQFFNAEQHRKEWYATYGKQTPITSNKVLRLDQVRFIPRSKTTRL